MSDTTPPEPRSYLSGKIKSSKGEADPVGAKLNATDWVFLYHQQSGEREELLLQEIGTDCDHKVLVQPETSMPGSCCDEAWLQSV